MLNFCQICFRAKGNKMLQIQLKYQLSIPFFSASPEKPLLKMIHTLPLSALHVYPFATLFFHPKLSSRFIHSNTKRFRSFIITSVYFPFCVYTRICQLKSRLFPAVCYYNDRMAIPFPSSLGKCVKVSL